MGGCGGDGEVRDGVGVGGDGVVSGADDGGDGLWGLTSKAL